MAMLNPETAKSLRVWLYTVRRSRDQTNGLPYCSRVCCMYAIKNALLIQQELPETKVTIFYIDMRAFW
jgi:heterodisulfide reductase subunit A-like polyferredoxin